MKKELITVTILLHHYQVRIIEGLRSGKINLEINTLRDIGKKIGIKDAPQQVKHHLEHLVNLGVIDKVRGKYSFVK